MSTIKISDLHSTGAELFSDSESYMNELGDNELNDINGGTRLGTIIKLSKAASNAASAGYRKAKSVVYRNSPQINQWVNEVTRPGGGLY
ncbi:hypothetical protein [Rivularia sp. UHCC 0363]|uniref:hypothetical protein n=1 Tax=Rivularia sp. UHCC 0363 TaxID=3110244 RepID=UPI002B1F28AA|nr:hypothetical protein [Rivularia sp. UHCC 0363]MEA5598440.1 hypothetical protein [Rivularia sp. UHCC 0363]